MLATWRPGVLEHVGLLSYLPTRLFICKSSLFCWKECIALIAHGAIPYISVRSSLLLGRIDFSIISNFFLQ